MKVISLSKKLEIKNLFKEGKRVYKEHLNVVYLFRNYDDETLIYMKIAYVVSKKISTKAVFRNKIKRRMRMAVQQVLKENEEKFNELRSSVLVAIRPASDKFIEASYHQIYLEIKQSLGQLIR